ncbi:unnamed protein product [marine sediment metagenome]|uniref:Peptidase M41 domain-containing protein n=1 Tax=marine sediment metagenome TaxID=412755 RepID=X1KBS4_9ZZZZ
MVAEQIDDEVHNIIQQAYQTAKNILTENKPKLIHIAQRLITEETIEGEALEALLTEPIVEPSPETSSIS